MRSLVELSCLAREYAEIPRDEARTARVEADPEAAEQLEGMARDCEAAADQVEGQRQEAER